MSKRDYGTILTAPAVPGPDTRDDMPVAYGDDMGRTIHHFLHVSDRDAFSMTYKTRLFHSWCVVKADENGFGQWYEWDGTQEDGSDGKWVELNLTGVVMSDSNGAIPKNIKTVVYGPGFSIQQAGDQEDAALVTYTPTGGGGGIDGITIDGHKLTEFNTGPNLQLDTGLGTGNTPRMLVRPDAFEAQHGNSCLIKLDMVETVSGQHPHAIYMPEEVVPTGEYYNLNPQAKGIDCQDNSGGDTAVTGGQMTEALAKISFIENALSDGNVKVWLEYKDPSDPIDKKILEDVNGKPFAVEKNFKSGDKIGDFIIDGAFMAKSTQPLKVMVETSFGIDEKITLDPVNTMLCLNQFSNGYETSVARIEFLRRAGLQITPAIQQFNGHMLSLTDEIHGITEGPTTLDAGSGTDTLNEFGVQNITQVSVEIKDDAMTIKDTGDIADFYVDVLIDNTHTRMLRGKEVTSSITIANPNNSFEYEAYKWTGRPDHVNNIYTTRTEGSININTNWEVIKGVFIAEQVNGNSYGHILTFTVPEDSNNILILVRPQGAQSPSTLKLSGFTWGTTKEFTGYVEIERYKIDEQHLKFDETYAEYLYTNEGYAATRYTINNTPPTGNPMPVGKLSKGKAPVELDNTVNQVPGSQLTEYDGAIKFLKDGEASISKSYNVWNEQGSDNTVTFWDVLIDVDGNETKIPDSERTFTVKANTGAPGVVYTIPAYAVDVEAGQRVGGRATSNKADGAYVQSQNISEYLVQTIIDFKELVAGGADDPWGNLDLSQFEHVYSHELDGRLIVRNTDSVTIPFVIDSDMYFDVKRAINIENNIARPVKNLDYSYNYDTNELRIAFGEVVTEGRVLIGIYL